MRLIVAIALVALAGALAMGWFARVPPGDPHARLREAARKTRHEIEAIDRQIDDLDAMRQGAWKRTDEGKFRLLERLEADEGALRHRRRQLADEETSLGRDLCAREGIVDCALSGDGPAGRAVALVAATALAVAAAFVARPRRWFE